MGFGRTRDSCPLCEGTQAVEQVCPPPLSWGRPLANLHYSVTICIVSLLGVYPLLKEDHCYQVVVGGVE